MPGRAAAATSPAHPAPHRPGYRAGAGITAPTPGPTASRGHSVTGTIGSPSGTCFIATEFMQ